MTNWERINIMDSDSKVCFLSKLFDTRDELRYTLSTPDISDWFDQELDPVWDKVNLLFRGNESLREYQVMHLEWAKASLTSKEEKNKTLYGSLLALVYLRNSINIEDLKVLAKPYLEGQNLDPYINRLCAGFILYKCGVNEIKYALGLDFILELISPEQFGIIYHSI